jgi:type IV pilus assembly protein PilQ
LDTQPPQVLIEGKIVEATENFTRQAGISWGATGVPIKVGNGSRGPVNMTPSFNINQGLGTGGLLNFGISMGTLDVFGNLSASLALSEREGQVKVISSPRIVALSNEKADINQTTEVPVRQITITNGVVQETFQFKPLTMQLEVTPQVTADGSVIMGIKVNRQFAGETQSQGEFAVNSREANTRVLVKNGETAVIGGIYQSDANKAKDGVPWIRDIPLFGALFEATRSSEQKSELLIFLTPRILGQTDSGTAIKTF